MSLTIFARENFLERSMQKTMFFCSLKNVQRSSEIQIYLLVRNQERGMLSRVICTEQNFEMLTGFQALDT